MWGQIMSGQNLSDDEIKVIKECIKAAAYGPFFIDDGAKDDPYWEIHPLFGLTIDELRNIADALPNLDLGNEKVKLAINNSINHLLGYPHGCSEEVWKKYISVSKNELEKIYLKWTVKKQTNYFEGIR
jgi:hypothetical protein